MLPYDFYRTPAQGNSLQGNQGTAGVVNPWQVNAPSIQAPGGATPPTGDPMNFISSPVLGETATAPSDPYAQYGGRSAYDNLVSGFNTQKQNIFGSSIDAAKNAGIGLKSSILDFVDSLRQGQRNVDNSAVNNELAKQRGTQDVFGSVSRGIQSGGVMLSNKNASDSSAAGALARAYGDVGRRGLSQVGNQYEMGNREIGLQQQTLDEQRVAGTRKLGESKQQVVGNIVAQARNSLAALDAAMLNASLPDRIAIEQEKENIRQKVLDELSQYDQLLTSETESVTPTSQEARVGEATRLASAGRAPTTAFDFQTAPAAEFQNTGPFASQLPIFTFNRTRRE